MSRQADMLHEFEQRRQAVFQEVAELRRNRERITLELARLSEEFNGKDVRLENAIARDKALNTRFAVIEKRLKEVRTQTSLLRKKRSEWGDEAASIQQEIAYAEAELTALGRRKAELDQGISTLESGQKDNLDALESASGKKQDILAKLEECKLQREGLSSEIAACLAAGVSEQDRIDSDLNDITLLLMNHIVERDGLKKVLVEKETAVAALRERVSVLDRRRRVLEEAKIIENRRVELSGSFAELSEEKERLNRKVEEQQGLRVSRQRELDSLSGENGEKQNRLTGLEASVGIYDELLFHIQEGQKRQSELLQSKGQVSQDIEGLMAENSRLDGELRMLEGRIKAIVNLADSEN